MAAFAVQAATTVPSGATVRGQCDGKPLTPGVTKWVDAAGVHHITGTPGNDVIEGTDGRDIIDGDAGDDIICSRAGADTIDGGDGNDTILPGGGADTIHGGNGVDTVSYQDAQHAVTAILGYRYASVYGLFNPYLKSDDAIYGVENLTGSPYSDTLVAPTAGGHRVDGLKGNDVLIGSYIGGSVLDGGPDRNQCSLGVRIRCTYIPVSITFLGN